ncbi:hypothetical protein GOODEAATRI_027285 [Goodea atripinnis]|uniref:Uncharacterized protein n=1 Tax=Goodea atripinnis TaxID=208336 RepID=A0ABV0MN22_9TELE
MCESKSKQALSHQERKVLEESTTPHCSFHPVGQPVSRNAWDDGALSFRFERVLKPHFLPHVPSERMRTDIGPFMGTQLSI